MIPAYNKIHNRFKLNGTAYNFYELKEIVYSLVKEGKPFEQDIGEFLLDWQDKNDSIVLKTSGSTGTPKTIKISKQAMVNSAIATGDYFNLKPGDKALLCLPATYIAGKMMLVRALVLGLELDCIQPKSILEITPSKTYDFSAMVPMQLETNINSLQNIKALIVGGASVSYKLSKAIQKLKTKVYETYGMTETVSHIAVKLLNNTSNSDIENNPFKILPNIAISQDKRACLVINAPQIINGAIVTNDIVKLHNDTSFSWLGRFDTIINSGGIKIIPEEIEAKLQGQIKSRFFIASEKNEKLGEAVILVVEGEEEVVNSLAFNDLKEFQKPKNIYTVSAFVETASGKIQRKKTLQKIK